MKGLRVFGGRYAEVEDDSQGYDPGVRIEHLEVQRNRITIGDPPAVELCPTQVLESGDGYLEAEALWHGFGQGADPNAALFQVRLRRQGEQLVFHWVYPEDDDIHHTVTLRPMEE